MTRKPRSHVRISIYRTCSLRSRRWEVNGLQERTGAREEDKRLQLPNSGYRTWAIRYESFVTPHILTHLFSFLSFFHVLKISYESRDM